MAITKTVDGNPLFADFGNGWIEIFRAGSYGDKGNFSADDLDRVIANYDPEGHEAPACIGHPADNLPAYGWASRLMRQGDTLLAKFKEVDPAFESAVKAGRFKKRSAAFYLDGAGKIQNLRHVAFLGAQPPEVKGLKNLNFEDNGRKFTQVDFGEEESVAAEEKSVKDQIKAFFAEMFGGQSQTPQTFSESDVKRIATEAATAAATPLQTKVTELEGKLAAQSTQFTERETKIATTETKQRAVDAINGLKAKGRWVPAFERMGLGLVFDELAKVTATVEFGEGETKKKLTPLAILADFMEAQPQIVPGGRVFDGSKVAAGTGKGRTGDPLTDAANARAAEKKITFSEAVDQVVAESPELAMPGRAHAGMV